MLYSRGSDFPHNGGYLPLISFVPQKSHWIYLALCTVVIMCARRSSRSFWTNPLPLSPSLPPCLSPQLSASLTISPAFFLPLSAAVETLLLICPGVICLRGVPERIDRVKSRLLTPPVPKHIHSPALLTPSFLCQAADTNWHIGGGREEGEGELGSGGCCPANQWIGQSAVFLSDVSCTSRNLSTDN